MQITNEFHDRTQIRIFKKGDDIVVRWPLGTNIQENDREFKIHSSIKRCIANRAGFNEPNVMFKSNIKVSRVDSLEYVDLFWTEIPQKS